MCPAQPYHLTSQRSSSGRWWFLARMVFTWASHSENIWSLGRCCRFWGQGSKMRMRRFSKPRSCWHRLLVTCHVSAPHKSDWYTQAFTIFSLWEISVFWRRIARSLATLAHACESRRESSAAVLSLRRKILPATFMPSAFLHSPGRHLARCGRVVRYCVFCGFMCSPML